MTQGKHKEAKQLEDNHHAVLDPSTNTIAYKGRLRLKENSWQPWLNLNLYGALQESFHQVHELSGAVHERSQTVRKPFMNINMCNNERI